MSDFVCKCYDGPHPTWGACQRAKNIRVGWAASARGLDRTKEKKWDSELALYKSAVDEGIQPAGTARGHVEAARIISDRTGSAFQAG